VVNVRRLFSFEAAIKKKDTQIKSLRAGA